MYSNIFYTFSSLWQQQISISINLTLFFIFGRDTCLHFSLNRMNIFCRKSMRVPIYVKHVSRMILNIKYKVFVKHSTSLQNHDSSTSFLVHLWR